MIKTLKKNEEMMMYLVNKNPNRFYSVKLGEEATLD